MKRLIMLIAVVCFCRTAVVAQVLNVDPVEKGKKLIFGSENRLYIKGDELNVAYAQYLWGARDGLNLCAAVGGTRIFRRDQAWVSVGENLRLFRVEKAAVSLYNTISMPLNCRHDASTALLNSMLIVSRPISTAVTIYSGINGLFPIGAKERGLFTPPDKKLNIPIGAAISRGTWTLFAEADIGHLKAVGVGIAKSLN